MREKYESLSLGALKEVAKARGLKGISTLKKSELVERMVEEDQKEKSVENKQVEAKGTENKNEEIKGSRAPMEQSELDSGITVKGILEVLPDGYGFIRSDNYLPGENDVYVSPSQIRRFNLKTGDILKGNTRVKSQNEKFSALLYVTYINDIKANEMHRMNFEDMTPIFPNKRLHLERPEEVTDIKEAIQGKNVEIIYSTFDELPEHHKRVSEMTIERAKRLVEHKKDVTIFIDSITRLARAYNLTVPPSGRTLSGGLDPAALHMPKRFFGAARNMREGGSLTILATALVDTGSKMDDVVYEEFKGTGNMELVLDRKLQEKRVFPAIDIAKSGTRREDLLLSPEEQEAVDIMRKALNGMKSEEATENILNMFARTKDNAEFVQTIKKQRILS